MKQEKSTKKSKIIKQEKSGEVNKKVKSLGAHYKDAEKSVISIVKYLAT